MKNKRNYSLTARERKEQRSAAQNKATPEQQRASEEQAMATAQAKARRSSVAVTVIVVVAVLAIVAALLIPVISYFVNPYSGYKTVVARFELSNGMTLEYEIDEQEYDIAATNFIFLAKNGYFDNTVFFDASSGWLRFGGYEAQPSVTVGQSSNYDFTHHHSHNKQYCANFAALPTSRFRDETVTYKFGYKLRADTNGTKTDLLRDGALTFLYGDMSTEFQFLYDKANMTDLAVRKDNSGNLVTETLEWTLVGFPLNDETVNNILTIVATAEKNDLITSGYQWEPPTPNIYIKTVKLYNLDKSKWKNFDFIDYMNGDDSSGRRRLSTWTGQI